MSGTGAEEIRVVDDFLTDPDRYRSLALGADYRLRDNLPARQSPLEETGELRAALDWPDGDVECRFQWYPEADASRVLLVHDDPREWSALVYLCRDRDGEPGTAFYRHRLTGFTGLPSLVDLSFRALELGLAPEALVRRIGEDQRLPEAWEVLREVEVRYNRLVLFPGGLFHGLRSVWGTTPADSRLTLNVFRGKRNRGEWCYLAPSR